MSNEWALAEYERDCNRIEQLRCDFCGKFIPRDTKTYNREGYFDFPIWTLACKKCEIANPPTSKLNDLRK